MKSYTITLPDEFAAMVDRMLAEKKFDDANHLMMCAVAQLNDEVTDDDLTDQEWLRKEIQIGIDQANRGQVAPLDMDAIRARVKQRLAAEKETAHAAGHANGSSGVGHRGDRPAAVPAE